MALILPCAKCGGEIEVPDETVKEALATGTPMKPQHSTCPNTPEGTTSDRTFHLVIQMFEVVPWEDDPDTNAPEDREPVEELLASFGGTVTAGSFKDAVPGLLKELNKGWEQVQNMAPIVDQG